MPLLVPLLEPVHRARDFWGPRSSRGKNYQAARRFQYAALNSRTAGTGVGWGATENAPPARSAVANVPRAATRDVKPDSKRDYRTSAADSADRAQSTRNIRGGNTEIFSLRGLPDSPHAANRKPSSDLHAHGIAGVSVGIAHGGKLSLAPTADNASWPATASSGEPLVDSPRCNIAPADGRHETWPRNLSADIAAAAASMCGVASRTVANKLKLGPREVCSLKVKSRRQGTTFLRGDSFRRMITPFTTTLISLPTACQKQTADVARGHRDQPFAESVRPDRESGPTQNRAQHTGF